MELLCPNCQKKLTVPEQYAGQMMRCPLCQGTFTVPSLPSAVPPAETPEPFGSFVPPPPPKAETYNVATEPAAPAEPIRPISSETPSATSAGSSQSAAPAASLPPSPPSAGYSNIRAFSINPQVVPWLAPGGLVLAFILTFFHWLTYPPHGESAWGIAFGVKKDDVVVLPIHGLMIFFDILTIFAMILAVVSQLYSMKIIPSVPALQPIDTWRPLLVGALAALAWCFYTLQIAIWLFSDGAILLNFWGILTWWVYTVAVAGAFIQFWLEQRGRSKPLPRVSLEW
jgi:hypothetical protein